MARMTRCFPQCGVEGNAVSLEQRLASTRIFTRFVWSRILYERNLRDLRRKNGSARRTVCFAGTLTLEPRLFAGVEPEQINDTLRWIKQNNPAAQHNPHPVRPQPR